MVFMSTTTMTNRDIPLLLGQRFAFVVLTKEHVVHLCTDDHV